MNLQVIKNRVLYWLKSLILYSLYTALLLVIMSFFVLQIPAVQTSISRYYLKSLSEITGFKTTISRMEFTWFDRIILHRVSITDPENNTMLYAKKVSVNFEFNHLIDGRNTNLDALFADSTHVYLKQIKESDTSENLNINIFINKINERYGNSGGGAGGLLRIGEAVVRKSKFTLIQAEADTTLIGFDPQHFAVDIEEAQLQNFIVLGDTVQFDVRSLFAKETKTHFEIKELATFFRISQSSMEFTGLKLRAGNSIISDTVIFTYNSQRDLNDFVHNVRIEAHMKNTVVDPDDLAIFAPATARINKTITLSGDIIGRVDRFRWRNMHIILGETQLHGSLDMDGLPDFNETFILLNLSNSKIRFDDFKFAFNEKTERRLRPLGTLNLNGQFLGYPTDFVAKGDFSSALGILRTDINLKVDENNFERSLYKGQLTMINFDLGTYLNDTTNFQKITMNGQVSGQGLTAQSANLKLNGKVQALGIRGYTYTNITTNARLAAQFFNGELIINDPNLEFTVNGSIDLRDNKNILDIRAKLDTALLHNLKLAKQTIFLQSDFNLNTQGFSLDSLSGDAHFNEFYIEYNNQKLNVSNVDVLALRNKNNRALELKNNLVDVRIEGNFTFTNLANDVQTLVKEFTMNVRNNKEELALYYASKKVTTTPYEARFTVDVKKIKPLATLLNLNLAISADTKLEGRFSSGNTSLIQAYTTIDTLRYNNLTFTDSEIEVNASKFADSTQALVMIYINSRQQQWGKLATRNFITEAIWDEHHINFDSRIDQAGRNNYIRLGGTIDFADSTYIAFDESTQVKLLENLWTIDSDNRVSVLGKEWHLHDIQFKSIDQRIGLAGNLSTDETKSLTLSIDRFNLASLNDLTLRALSGALNARVSLADVYNQYTIQNTIFIDDLRVDDFLIGDITGNNVWNAVQKRFDLEFLIDRNELRIVNCNGYYDPYDKVSPLNIQARFDNANLKIFEPFIDDLLSNFSGTLTGTYSITGNLNQPTLNGMGRVENGQLMVNYLKTTYQFTGGIGLTPNSIYFEKIELRDVLRNTATLSGAITHRNFASMEIDLNARYQNFQVLNTNVRDNNLFYGQAYASGDVRLTGPINNLKIVANATTDKNTKIYIPIAGTSSVEQKDFINFVNFADSTYQATLQQQTATRIDLTGVTLDFNIDVTPDAYCEIIFDAKAGDIIRGRGNGKLKLQLDTKGEFNMFGPIEFTEGGYNFTLYDIINKEFQIQPGSLISWYGDPYTAVMDIKATYNQLASLGPIIQDQSQANAPQLRRKYPVQVLLKLEGPMLSPLINFDILAKELPQSVALESGPPIRLDFEFNAFKNRLDEQELKRQVFSLIVLRKFSPPESFNTSGSLVNSVSELFSNQLSYWMSQVDENLEIDVDLGTMDQEAFNTFQLRLSYTFLNGRLRITRDGTFGNQVNSTTPNANTRNDFSTMAGDWTVDYLLTPDGKFKVKMYSRTNVNPVLNNLNNQSTITTGVSLSHTQSFNQLRDLLKASRDKNRRRKEDEAQDINKEAIENKNEEGSD